MDVWLKIKQEGQTAGLGPCFHSPGFHFGTGFLSHSHVSCSEDPGVFAKDVSAENASAEENDADDAAADADASAATDAEGFPAGARGRRRRKRAVRGEARRARSMPQRGRKEEKEEEKEEKAGGGGGGGRAGQSLRSRLFLLIISRPVCQISELSPE